MRSKFFLLLVVLLVCQSARAQTVNETGVRIVLGDGPATVILPVDSPTDLPEAKIRLDLLDAAGKVKVSAGATYSLTKGANSIKVPIEVADAIKQDDFRFYRLRYEVAGKSGVLSLAKTAADMFDLEAFSFDFPQEISRYMVRVRAIHPVSLKGVGNVHVEGKLNVEFNKTERKTIEMRTVTDADGFAAITFQLPEFIKIDDIEVEIKGAKNGFVNQVSKELPEYAYTRYSHIYFQTDKPLYQPGQVLRVRSLFFNDKRKAIADDPLTFTIKDEEGTVMSKTEVRTSRFGIASLEWQIPENVKLGKYSIVVSSERELNRDQKQFKISRYELPNFSVSAETDRKYYLPDHKSASVEVRADYLFGKPVTSAKVRVVQEVDREWNWKLQKYETKDGQVREGTIDATGKFTADFDLEDIHKGFGGNYWQKFKDAHFAAYVTDLSTNRTEQKRFDIRLTKEAIHLYLVSANDDEELSRRLPPRFYLTAFYADGTPAECEFGIYREHEDSENDYNPKTGKLLARGKTDRLGAARVTMPLGFMDEDDNDLELVIKAKDRGGNRGIDRKDLDFDLSKPAAQVSTDKVVYRKGDPIQIDVVSSEQNAPLFLSIIRNIDVVVNEKVQLRDGRASITVPYTENLKGPLTVAVYGSYRNDHGSTHFFGGNRTVIYPTPSGGMQLSATSSKETYRPGEEATLELAAYKTGGEVEESAFGISVLDKAIDERARTDSEFGGRYESFYSDFADLMDLGAGYGGFSGAELNNMDTTKPLSPEGELAIEIALKRRYYPELENSGNFQDGLGRYYRETFDKQFSQTGAALEKRYRQQELAATDEASLRRILAMDGIDIEKMSDPWGNRYRVAVHISQAASKISVSSAGPDEVEYTADDITAFTRAYGYFQETGSKINRTFSDYEKRTEDFILNYKTLRDEMRRQNFDLDGLRDAWGKPYRFSFGVEGSRYVLKIESGGWDRKFGGFDDFTIWTRYADYFDITRANMAAGIRKHVRESGKFPADEAEFRSAIKFSGYDLETVKDVFGRQYYIARETRSRFADRRRIGQAAKTEITPVSQDMVIYAIKSMGNDGVRGSADDFELTRFIGIVSEKTTSGITDSRAKTVPSSSVSMGGMTGVVTDTNGAVIPGAKITAQYSWEQRNYETRTDESGEFVIGDLPPGIYELSIEAPGFKKLTIISLYVEQQTLTEINAVLEVGNVTSTVDVSADSVAAIDTTNTTVTVSSSSISNLPINGRRFSQLLAIAPTSARSGLRDASGRDRDPSVPGSTGPDRDTQSGKTAEQIATPRLREYFPETLAWFPELISGADGKARFKFKMADNLTTWKVAVIGSTANGDIAVAEKEIKTFQPFFVDLDPPKFLTNGDEISLPVQVRNYTETKQNVNVTMARADWFSFLGAEKQQVDVEAGNSQNAIFGFKAIEALKDGKQRVTAIAQGDSDAIEKPVTVRPDGEEIVKTSSQLFTGSTEFDVSFPADALAKTQKAELKIYPNLMSHVTESIEGLLRRPYGCGEQTISSTYPNLMILKFVNEESELAKKARSYLRKGYDRLTGYQGADGGFTYWGARDTSDVALTAYALRFLNDAKEFVAVDDEVIKKAQDWLVKQQKADGSWTKKYYNETTEDHTRTKLFTSYVARTLAMAKEKDTAVLGKALDYLKTRNSEVEEPYALALYGLASLDAGRAETAGEIARRLEKMAIAEGNAVYWNLETNTPFYGWGTAGRLETTALVLQLLVREERLSNKQDANRRALIGKGTLFLLKNKDQYGVWYSTQTTINVLDAFLATLTAANSSMVDKIQVFVNGRPVQEMPFPRNTIEPLTLDLTGELDPVANKVEIRSPGLSALMAHIVATHYIEWRNSQSTNQNATKSRMLRLDYRCDRMSAAIMQDITCSVETERVGFRGYGMLLAEIGTPPGANVSRESLQEAMDADWSISRYDILPDRIVVYMWAKAGGTKFNFKFKPRYGINAQTPASCVYDYYNPEAKAVGEPLRFVVK